MKIIVLDGYTLNPGDLAWDALESLGDVSVYDRTPKDALLDRIGDAEVVLTNKTPLDADAIRSLPNLKYIGVLATGYNVVDIPAAREAGIVVTNIPTYGTDSVAQFVFALLLEVCHHAGAHSSSVKAGDWSRSEDFCYWNFPLIELAGKTMGIIGWGRIGQATARIAQAFGMRVLAYSRYPDKSQESDSLSFASLEELYAASDVISLNSPLTPDTEGIINKDSIAGMKDGVIIINTARGPLVVEKDLADALASGKVQAAGLDVVSTEPIKEDNPLLAAPNCIITPHIAWAPIEARQRLMDTAVSNVKAFLEGSPQNNVAE